jgi:hypothetical protein
MEVHLDPLARRCGHVAGVELSLPRGDHGGGLLERYLALLPEVVEDAPTTRMREGIEDPVEERRAPVPDDPALLFHTSITIVPRQYSRSLDAEHQ